MEKNEIKEVEQRVKRYWYTDGIAELASGTIAPGAVDVYPDQIARRTVTINAQRTSEVLGLDLETGDIHHHRGRRNVAQHAGALGKRQVGDVMAVEPVIAIARRIEQPEDFSGLISKRAQPSPRPRSNRLQSRHDFVSTCCWIFH